VSDNFESAVIEKADDKVNSLYRPNRCIPRRTDTRGDARVPVKVSDLISKPIIGNAEESQRQNHVSMLKYSSISRLKTPQK